jgi:hypothetical protein
MNSFTHQTHTKYLYLVGSCACLLVSAGGSFTIISQVEHFVATAADNGGALCRCRRRPANLIIWRVRRREQLILILVRVRVDIN